MKVDVKISKSTYFLISLVFGGSIFLLAPLGVYVENVDEFSVLGRDLISVLSLCVLVAVVVTFVCFLVLDRTSELLLAGMAGLVFGISLSIVIQSQFFLWEFGPLDGRKIDWERWTSIGRLELLLWVASPSFSIFVALRYNAKFRMAINGLFLFVLVSISGKLLQVDFSDIGDKESPIHDETFSFDTSNNTLLIVLDTLQADIFGEILTEHPRDLDYLKGFTYYPNTLGGYPTTRVSVSLMLSGKSYKNEIPLTQWVSEEVTRKTIVDYFRNTGSHTSIVLNGAPAYGVQHAIIDMATIGYSGWRKLGIQVTSVLDAGLFSLVPTLAKPSIYDDGNWTLSKSIHKTARTPKGAHGADARFVQAFENYFDIQPSLKGSFKYFHLRGAHYPLQVDENFQSAKRTGSEREDFVRQTRGVFSNLRPMIQTLIENGIYADTEILIVGDHGSLSVPVSDIRKSNSAPNAIENTVISSSRPVFLHKQKGEAAVALRVSEDARHLADIPCILSGHTNFFGCEKKAWPAKGNSPRKFYYYRWKHKYWGSDYMPPIQSYTISGDVRDLNSWSKGAAFPGPEE
tara:strand:- start:621 stop:2336 length:1716 start_codon:yes stop_codon:yes gene_type:complete